MNLQKDEWEKIMKKDAINVRTITWCSAITSQQDTCKKYKHFSVRFGQTYLDNGQLQQQLKFYFELGTQRHH